MAFSDVREDLDCSVCLNIYGDPVTLTCGHSFCRVCIDRALNAQDTLRVYSCPECRKTFHRRPSLHRNITLKKIIERLRQAQTDRETIGICCTHCIHTPVAAVKSCLLCEASLCANHLSVHSKAPEHVLCDPATDLQNRKCSVHKSILEYYCAQDSTCICVSCRLDGDHQGHRVEMLGEAAEKKKKQLGDALQILATTNGKANVRYKRLQNRRKSTKEKAASEERRVTSLIRDIQRNQDELKTTTLNKLRQRANQASNSFTVLIQQLEKKMEEHSRKISRMKMLCDTTDPVTILQEAGDLCDPEDDQDGMEHDGIDLDVADVSRTLHEGLANILSASAVKKPAEKPVSTTSMAGPSLPTPACPSDRSVPAQPRPVPKNHWDDDMSDVDLDLFS